MSRSARLLTLMQALRRRRRPVSAATLAAELGVSLRTVYRDIATLTEQGALIEGEAGLGYVLRPGFFLPPLMFGDDELDAIILGLSLVGARGDADLTEAAAQALAKIAATLPPPLSAAVEGGALRAGPRTGPAARHLPVIRQAMRAERKLRLGYTDRAGAGSDRIVWPIFIGFFEASEVLAAWCETRTDFRHFRLDRISRAIPLDARMPKRRRVLLAEWRVRHEMEDG